MIVILPGHAADQGRLGCLVVLGESQDAASVASLALDLLRFPLPGNLPDEPFRVRERDGDCGPGTRVRSPGARQVPVVGRMRGARVVDVGSCVISSCWSSCAVRVFLGCSCPTTFSSAMAASACPCVKYW